MSLVTCQTLWMLRCNMFSGRKKKPLPIYFLTHLRWAGCVELGERGRLLLCQLDHILLQPGSCPATESLRDVRKTGFLRQLKRPCTVYGDGAKSYKKLEIWVQTASPLLPRCTHYKMEFTRKTKSQTKGTHQWNTVAGTRSGATWSASYPSRSIAKTKLPGRILKEIQQYAWSFAYHWNHKEDLKGSLANLCTNANAESMKEKSRASKAVEVSFSKIHICQLFSPKEFNDQWINS